MRRLEQRKQLARLAVVASEDVSEVSELPLSHEVGERPHARSIVDVHVRDSVDPFDAQDHAQAVGAEAVYRRLHALGQRPRLASVE